VRRPTQGEERTDAGWTRVIGVWPFPAAITANFQTSSGTVRQHVYFQEIFTENPLAIYLYEMVDIKYIANGIQSRE
jgi:hypothetical protein